MSADIPIIFSAPMILALLYGRKTMTRRLAWRQVDRMSKSGSAHVKETKQSPWQRVKPGDRLWVREQWRTPENFTKSPAELVSSCKEAGFHTPWCPIAWEADGTKTDWGENWRERGPGRLRAAMHLPRVYSRLTLIVTATKIERLQEISEEDAKAEGVTLETVGCEDGQNRALWFGVPHVGEHTAREAFSTLWDSLHNPNGWCADDNPRGWAASPEVVAMSFTGHKTMRPKWH